MIHLSGTNRPIFCDRYPGQGTFECGIDTRAKAWPGELFVVAGPDPRILVADEVLRTLVHHPEQVHPGVTLTCDTSEPCPPQGCCRDRFCGVLALRGNNCFFGALLSFDTTSGRIVYRVGIPNTELNAWEAAWPD